MEHTHVAEYLGASIYMCNKCGITMTRAEAGLSVPSPKDYDPSDLEESDGDAEPEESEG